MKEIRKNKEKEVEIIRAKFKIPTVIIVILCFVIGIPLLMLIPGILGIIIEFNSDSYITPIGSLEIMVFGGLSLVFWIPIAISLILWILGIKKSYCVVTNKRITGVTSTFISKKKYSYRLDEIDNVEVFSTLGIHGLTLNFSQGNGPQGTVIYQRGVATLNGAGVFKIRCIANINEVFGELSNLLTSVKNDKDLMTDIEMNKVDAENRKADALENIATNLNGSTNKSDNNESTINYIQELKELKNLLDLGIITDQEFEQKKKELLN